ncbi:hypothetical protein GCM10009783_02850 [Glycomyces lechevalierae]
MCGRVWTERTGTAHSAASIASRRGPGRFALALKDFPRTIDGRRRGVAAALRTVPTDGDGAG